MGSTYQRATRVLIWLGEDESEEAEEAEEAFLLVCSIANRANDDSEDNSEDGLNEALDKRSERNPTINSHSSTTKSDFRSNKKFEGSPQGDLETNPAASPEYNADNNSVENSGKDIAAFMKDSISEPFSNSDEPPPWDSSLWESAKSLLDKSWVVQEAILAKSATVIWGDAEIDRDWIGTAASEIWDNY